MGRHLFCRLEGEETTRTACRVPGRQRYFGRNRDCAGRSKSIPAAQGRILVLIPSFRLELAARIAVPHRARCGRNELRHAVYGSETPQSPRGTIHVIRSASVAALGGELRGVAPDTVWNHAAIPVLLLPNLAMDNVRQISVWDAAGKKNEKSCNLNTGLSRNVQTVVS